MRAAGEMGSPQAAWPGADWLFPGGGLSSPGGAFVRLAQRRGLDGLDNEKQD
jgi:hypothetical protein